MFARYIAMLLKPRENDCATGRNVLVAAAISMVMTSAACNSITGAASSAVGINEHQAKSSQGVPTPQKLCIDDLREVEITSPGEGMVVHNGDEIAVSWSVEQFCGEYTARVRISVDGGTTWQTAFLGQNATSMLWRVPQLDDLRPVLEVTVEDVQGSVVDEQAVGFTFLDPRRPARRAPQRD